MTVRHIQGANTAVEVAGGRIISIVPVLPASLEVRPSDHYPQGIILAPRHDHHLHPLGYAAAVSGLSVAEAGDLAGMAELVRTAAAGLGPGQALVGHRLDDEKLAEGRLPTRTELDAMVPDRPLLLHRYCGHLAVANTEALTLAAVASETGVLRETEIQPVTKALTPLQPPLTEEEAVTALTRLARLGLAKVTAIVSAGEPLWCAVPNEIEFLLAVAPRVPLDFELLVIAATPGELRRAAEQIRAGPPNVTFRGWKAFADGALGARTAALYEPFSDEPGNSGILRLDPQHALVMARACLDLSGSVAIHAIGDLANDRVLDLYQELDRAEAGSLRIEHASVLRPASVERMARLGVTASVQPSFITSEVDWLRKRLGSRTALAYPLAALAEAGVPLLGGSDAPVESPDPLAGIAAAITGAGLDPHLAFSLFGGEIEAGQPADLLVTDRDPRLHPHPEETKVLAVYRHGELLADES